MTKFYVYDLIDPRNGEVFYVGKGTGNRVRQHVRGAQAGRVANIHKHRRIMEIIESGHQVTEQIVAEFDSEATAYQFERQRIDQFGDQLTNIANGMRTSEEIAPSVASYWLSRMKSFDQWVATTSEYRLKAIRATGRTPREFYDDSTAFLRQMAAMG